MIFSVTQKGLLWKAIGLCSHVNGLNRSENGNARLQIYKDKLHWLWKRDSCKGWAEGLYSLMVPWPMREIGGTMTKQQWPLPAQRDESLWTLGRNGHRFKLTARSGILCAFAQVWSDLTPLDKWLASIIECCVINTVVPQRKGGIDLKMKKTL